MPPTPLSRAEARARLNEANEFFTPSTPVAEADLFAGRKDHITRILRAVKERGQHVILYGERGVGKSSLALNFPRLKRTSLPRMRYIKIQAFLGDGFNDVLRKLVREIRADFERIGKPGVWHTTPVPGFISEVDFVTEIRKFKASEIPIMVIDEFDAIEDKDISRRFSSLIKELSDLGSNITMFFVGVAANVSQLVQYHESIGRCIAEIQVPRMSVAECCEILDERLKRLDMSMSDQERGKLIHLSKGLPSLIHFLGKNAVLNSLEHNRTLVDASDIHYAMSEFLTTHDQSKRGIYFSALTSNDIRHVLMACGLCKTDEFGWFGVTEVTSELIRNLKILIDRQKVALILDQLSRGYNNFLKKGLEMRGEIFRFFDPEMQPYVTIKGISDGFISERARVNSERNVRSTGIFTT